MLFNIFEILDIIIMTAILGYLFHDIFRKPTHGEDILSHYRKKKTIFLGMNMHDFLWACMIIVPSILFHELGHKFVGLYFNIPSTFHASCSSAYLFSGGVLDTFCVLTIVTIILKIMGIGIFFFVPGYVVPGIVGTPFQEAMIAVAGPFVNLIFWLGAAALLKSKKRFTTKQLIYLNAFRQINMLLFIFNMLPIPIFDGFKFYAYLFHLLIG